ncbi:MAG: radical SAM family heme chaperone HemW [Lachnospiraceae bacterium]|nr:radical SAM family heme chaperone HemW [Lachnospiraceae bacterium]
MKKIMELYLHIPFCVKKCAYCDFLSAPADEATQREYVAALLQEIAYMGAKCRDREVSTIYIGGGTPSWLQEAYLAMILEQIFLNFTVRSDAEVSIECNPGTLTKEKLYMYAQYGVNRLSIGLQSTMDDELKLLGRIHTYDQFLRNYELARELGYGNINVDLMSALPYQSKEKYMTSLQRVIALRPEHISAYSLIIEKGTPFYEQYKFDAVKREAGMPTDYLPSEETEYEIYKGTQSALAEAGYHHYEVSNYAKPGYECRHNIGYWKRTDYLGLGLGAASLMDNVRYTNTTDLAAYLEGVKILSDQIDAEMMQTLSEEEKHAAYATNLHRSIDAVSRMAQMEEFMFLGLRMTEGITRQEFYQNFGVQIEGVYGQVLPQLVSEGLIEQKAGQIRLSERGMDISNYVLSQFLLG